MFIVHHIKIKNCTLLLYNENINFVNSRESAYFYECITNHVPYFIIPQLLITYRLKNANFKLYHKILIKANNKLREVHAPQKTLKQAQRISLFFLNHTGKNITKLNNLPIFQGVQR